jgi:hypothetical protein
VLDLAIGQNLLITGLHRELPGYTTANTVEQVLAAGASDLPKLASSPGVLEALWRGYTQALRDVFILGLSLRMSDLAAILRDKVAEYYPRVTEAQGIAGGE